MNRPLLDPTAEEECRALRLAVLRWRVAALVCFLAALMACVILITTRGAPARHQSALPIKGMIVCLTLVDVARIKAHGGQLP